MLLLLQVHRYLKIKWTSTSKMQIITCMLKRRSSTAPREHLKFRNISENSIFRSIINTLSWSIYSPCLAKHSALEHNQTDAQPCNAVNTDLSVKEAFHQTWRSKHAVVKSKTVSFLSHVKFSCFESLQRCIGL